MAKQREKQYRLFRNDTIIGYYNTGSYPLRLARHYISKGDSARIEFRTCTAARAQRRDAWAKVWPLNQH
ncbi:MAG: hypothetical protein ACKO0Z_05055 [Betaproteobacteria bacterium]